MSPRKAVYAASLDPITNGHINVIERMAPLYDELVVVVAVDARKNYTFTPEERVEMARSAVAHLPNVSVDVCIGRYVVKHTESVGAQVIVRGLRNFKDLEDEQTLAEENRKICPQIETVWVPCLPHLMHVSSSMVKGHVGIDPEWEYHVARSVPAAVVIKLKEKYILGKAKKHWETLMSALRNPIGSEHLLKDLLGRYSQPHRAYHNLSHVVAMLDELAMVGEGDPAVALAIWFHDAIYDPRAKDNEQASVQLAAESIRKIGLPDAMAEQVCEMILATQHTAAPADRLGQMLVDIDLLVLGQPQKDFDAYEAAIRAEYDWVPRAEFRTGRCRILQTFLDRDSIYSTELFRSKYEAVARENLRRSIEMLSR